MKIKAVCERTGLTDRTIRYYIDQGLIAPAYTENYFGRKTFNFTEADIEQLNDIAVLRKFELSLDEIRELVTDPQKGRKIIAGVLSRTKKSVAAGQERLAMLSSLSQARSFTVGDLARSLSDPAVTELMKEEPPPLRIGKRISDFIHSLILTVIAWSPALVLVYNLLTDLSAVAYPTSLMLFDLKWTDFWGVLIWMLPTFLLLLLPKLKWQDWKKQAVRVILLVLCLLNTIICVFFISILSPISATTDVDHYLQFDAQCPLNQNILLRQVFPEEAEDSAVYDYCYRTGTDGTDVLLEQTLSAVDIEAEITRVDTLLSHAVGDRYSSYVNATQGEYQCLMLYTGEYPFAHLSEEHWEFPGELLMVAYNKQTGRIRYVASHGRARVGLFASPPTYIELDW